MSIEALKTRPRYASEVFRDVVIALFLREIKTRFGNFRLGFIWALIEPLTHIVVFTALWGIRGHWLVHGVYAPFFILTGILPFNLFANITNRSMTAVAANRGLFNFQQVRPIHTLLARWMLEFYVFIVVFNCFLAIAWWFELPIVPENLLEFLLALAVLMLFSVGFGLLACSLITLYPETEKVIPLLLRPLYFVSGVFFASITLPSTAVSLLSWNPIFCLIDWMRHAYLGLPMADGMSISYAVKFALILFLCGLWSYSRNWVRMVAS